MTRALAQRAALSAALCALTLLAFQGLFSCAFVNYDDDVYVTANPHVQQGFSAGAVRWAFTTTHASNWHPLTWLSHMLDVRLFGLAPGRHHATSLLLHVLNAILLFLLLARASGAVGRPALVAALFALHPLHVESVAWIAERKDVLSTCFCLLAILAWMRYLASRTRARYLAVVALYACALLAKPMPVTLPFMLLLLDFWPLARLALPLRFEALAPLLREKLPLFAMAAVSCAVTLYAQHAGGAVQTLESFSLAERLANAVSACAFYLGRTFLPGSLAVFYPYPHGALFSLRILGGLLGLLAISALALRFARTAPFLAFGWLFFVGTLVPVIGLVQVGGQSKADRYTYVPLIGIFVALVWGLCALAPRRRGARAALVCAALLSLAALAAATRRQVSTWMGSVPLFEHALEVTEENWLAHNNLGGALSDSGKVEQALPHFQEALRIKPEYADAHNNLGLALARTGRMAEAIPHFERALAIRPDFAKAHNNLAGALAASGRLDLAIEHLEQALRLEPADGGARHNLARSLLGSGRIEPAIAQYRELLRVAPDDAAAREGLAVALNEQGVGLARANHLPEAAERFREALQLRPGLEAAKANLRNAEEALRRDR